MDEALNPIGRRGALSWAQSARIERGRGDISYWALMAGAALALAAGSAAADDAAVPLDRPLTETAQTSSSGNTKAEEDTVALKTIAVDAKADVITGGVQLESDEIERLNPQTLRDLFRQEPGVTVGSPMPVSQKVYVNGIEDTNLAVDIDGARQANKTYHHQGTTILDPGLFKAVKIESGVAPADAGPMALAGSMSLETKDGRDLIAPGNLFGGFGKFSFNNNGDAFKEELAVGAQKDGVDIIGYGMKEWGNDFADGAGNDVEGTRPSATNFIGKIAYTAPNGYRYKFAVTRYDDIAVRDARTNFNTITNGFLTTSYHDYSRQSETFSFGDETPTATWDPKVTLSHTFTHLDSFQHANNRNIIARVESFNGKASNTLTTERFGKITSGVDFFQDTMTGGVTSSGPTDRGETVTNYGVFTQARTSWTDEFRTSVGARLDHNRFEGNDESTHNNTGASANVNGEYDFTEQVMGYAGAGTVFGGIPLSEAGIQQNQYSYDGIDPSRSYNTKVGTNVAYGDYTFDGHLFYTIIKDAHDLTTSNRATNYDVHTRGGNASVRYDYQDGFLRAGYSHVTFRVDGIVPSSGGGEYYYGSLLGDMFSFEAEHLFPQYNVRLGTTNEWWLENDETEGIIGEALDSYFVANLYGEWRPERLPGLLLRLDIRNLFDKDYADRANTGIFSTNAAVAEFKEPGRSFVLSAKYEF